MVLDSGREIYVWVGIQATEQEREAGFNMAQVQTIESLLRLRLQLNLFQ